MYFKSVSTQLGIISHFKVYKDFCLICIFYFSFISINDNFCNNNTMDINNPILKKLDWSQVDITLSQPNYRGLTSGLVVQTNC